MKFNLSSRQEKELFDRARPLAIALPCPPEEPADALKWAQSVLNPALHRMMRSAEIAEIVTQPTPGATGATGLLGAIIEPGRIGPDTLTLTVVAVVVEISPDRPRGGPMPVQWAGRGEGSHWRY